MARRRYQKGRVFLRGKREVVWIGRWREDFIDETGAIRRKERSEVLGAKRELPTKKLALRELEARLSPVNNINYRAMRIGTFSRFASEWQKEVLSTMKPSTVSSIASQLKVNLVPFFGEYGMRDITTRVVQSFISSRQRKAPKTVRNFVLTLHMMWRQAKAWNYVSHDPFDGLVLPKTIGTKPRFFTEEEVKRIIDSAVEPDKTLYWIAAETGLRAGELFGLRVKDVDLVKRSISVYQKIWNRKVQEYPKTPSGEREFAISAELVLHLSRFIAAWRPNDLGLLFATAPGQPHDRSQFVARRMKPLLDSLGIKRCGLKAFRHTNGSLMDRLGTPMKLRQERLGHAPGSDVTMVVYTHSITDDDHKVAAQLGAMLKPSTCAQVAPNSVN